MHASARVRSVPPVPTSPIRDACHARQARFRHFVSAVAPLCVSGLPSGARLNRVRRVSVRRKSNERRPVISASVIVGCTFVFPSNHEDPRIAEFTAYVTAESHIIVRKASARIYIFPRKVAIARSKRFRTSRPLESRPVIEFQLIDYLYEKTVAQFRKIGRKRNGAVDLNKIDKCTCHIYIARIWMINLLYYIQILDIALDSVWEFNRNQTNTDVLSLV